jgi:hypothetical protein
MDKKECIVVDPKEFTGWGTSTSLLAEWSDISKEWVITHKLVQKRRAVGSLEWDEKEIFVRSSAPTIERALSQSTLSIMTYMEQVEGDLFKEIPNADTLLN